MASRYKNRFVRTTFFRYFLLKSKGNYNVKMLLSLHCRRLIIFRKRKIIFSAIRQVSICVIVGKTDLSTLTFVASLERFYGTFASNKNPLADTRRLQIVFLGQVF